MDTVTSFVVGVVFGAGIAFGSFAICNCCCDHAEHCAPASCCPPDIVKRIEALEVKVFHSGATEEEAK